MPTEATFLLAGLFLVAAATGWAFVRYSLHDRGQPPPPVNADYLRGLNLVLNRQTDEALELFVKMAKVDEETLETHFALGHLFRRRGEVDQHGRTDGLADGRGARGTGPRRRLGSLGRRNEPEAAPNQRAARVSRGGQGVA